MVPALKNIKLAIGRESGGDHGGENEVATPQITVVSVKQRRMNLIESMESNHASTNITGIPVRTIDRDIAWLKENGYLKREGSDRSGTWIVLKKIGKMNDTLMMTTG